MIPPATLDAGQTVNAEDDTTSTSSQNTNALPLGVNKSSKKGIIGSDDSDGSGAYDALAIAGGASALAAHGIIVLSKRRKDDDDEEDPAA